MKANVIQVNPHPNIERYRPSWRLSEDQQRQFHFKGVAKDIFDAPDPIKDYLCKLYNLHEIAIFGKGAGKHLQEIVYQIGIRKFFVGNEL